MEIGVPREIKPLEGRVALTPDACQVLVSDGHKLLVEHDAGKLSGYTDEQYLDAGARIEQDADGVYKNSNLIIKVKEPIAEDLQRLKQDHLLFCFLHLAANPDLTRALQDIGLTAVGFETVEGVNGGLPLLAPMSDIAGRLAAQIGATLLYQYQGGKGLLLGGLPDADKGRVVIVGAGTAGSNAAAMAAAMGAEVVVFDLHSERLAAMRALGDNVMALHSSTEAVAREVARADLLIGAALKTGRRSPHIVSREMVAMMQPGSVVIDISVDQGGCIETTRPTSYENPTYVEEGVLHFAVTNMPGAVPRSASQALSGVLLPYVRMISQPDWRTHKDLLGAINVEAGKVVHPALQESLA